MKKEIVLASSSPRRRELLAKTGFAFTVDPADIDESIDETGDLQQEIARLAWRKASAVAAQHPQAIVIGCDTIVVYDGKKFGKPKDEAEAGNMLRQLQGRSQQIITGLCVLGGPEPIQETTVAEVRLAPMSEQEIAEYVATGEPMGKAGAYAVQGIGGRYVEAVQGDWYSIIGLPLHRVYAILRDLEEEKAETY